MAIIKCPECGNEISTNAKACPHCGTAIKICPDCGAVYAGSPQTCTNCGFAFTKTNTSDNADELTGEAIKKQWLARASEDKNITRYLKYTNIGFYIFDVAVAIIAIILILVWYNSDPVDRLFSAENTLNNVRLCVILGCIAYILVSVSDYASKRIVQLRFSNWLQTNNVDLNDYIRLHQNNLSADSGEQENFMLVANAEYLRENSDAKKLFYITLVVKIILSILAGVLMGCCLIENVRIIMEYIALEQDIDFSQLNYVLIIAMFAAEFLNFIVETFLTGKQTKKMENWLNTITKS